MYGVGAALIIISAVSLPSPENLVIFMTAAGVGAGFGASSAYVVWLQKTTPARIRAMQELDKAQRSTTMAELKEAREHLTEATGKYEQLSNAVDKLEQHLDDEKILNDKLRADLLEFALSVLHQKGHIDRETKGSTGA